MDLVALKVAIGLRPNGEADHPNFNSVVPSEIRGGMDWSLYVDQFGGWQYDKKSGHRESDSESPLGVQHGVILVPREFALLALTLPNVSEIDEAELESFYDERAHAHEPDIIENEQAMKVVRLIMDRSGIGHGITADERTQLRKAYDPDDDTPGLHRNQNKTWQRFKAKKTINVVPSNPANR